MQHILSLIGSPRKKGNTAIMASKLISHFDKNTFKNETVFLGEMNIDPCIDCRACKTGDLLCPIPDDMQEIYRLMDRSNLLVFGTPIYWYTPSAQMKLLIDRLRPYYKNVKLKSKKAVLLLPAGSGAGDCVLTIEMFKRIFNTLKVEYLGVVTAEAYDEGDVLNNQGVHSEIKKLAIRVSDELIGS